MGKNEYNQYQLVIYSQLLAKRKGPKKKKKKSLYKWEIPNVLLLVLLILNINNYTHDISCSCEASVAYNKYLADKDT